MNEQINEQAPTEQPQEQNPAENRKSKKKVIIIIILIIVATILFLLSQTFIFKVFWHNITGGSEQEAAELLFEEIQNNPRAQEAFERGGNAAVYASIKRYMYDVVASPFESIVAMDNGGYSDALDSDYKYGFGTLGEHFNKELVGMDASHNTEHIIYANHDSYVIKVALPGSEFFYCIDNGSYVTKDENERPGDFSMREVQFTSDKSNFENETDCQNNSHQYNIDFKSTGGGVYVYNANLPDIKPEQVTMLTSLLGDLYTIAENIFYNGQGDYKGLCDGEYINEKKNTELKETVDKLTQLLEVEKQSDISITCISDLKFAIDVRYRNGSVCVDNRGIWRAKFGRVDKTLIECD